MKYLTFILLLTQIIIASHAQKNTSCDKYVLFQKAKASFALSIAGKTTSIYIDSTDYPGVIRATGDLQTDLEKVTNNKPNLWTGIIPKANTIVIIGTLGKNRIIDKLVKEKKISVEGLKGKWETFLIQTIKNPLPGIEQALVIAGSDKRGTIYGIYDLSEQIGISPWYWWADVVPEKKSTLYVKSGRYIQSPSVTYRGLFLNDEYPNLTRWIKEKFGTIKPSTNPPIPINIANYNHAFYSKVFELILRLKGNYLWPAMWNNAFNEDDSENPRLADEYGIVMGTSHQEPMLRAQKEWDRRYQKTLGSWNYAQYPDTIRNFWREGLKRNKNYESIITLGLRGANDTEMAPGGPEANKTLLENIIKEQRKIIVEEVNPDITKVPQMWCLYKEVQDYYNAGMRVPDDVTLLWAEDNWGNVRRLPSQEEQKRIGGSGIYYHFDYHGGPRSYQWINTNPIAKIWDQMSLSKQYGADRIWIVNVGHLKGYEFPLEYFMKLAWNTDQWTNNNINEFTQQWAQREFGSTYADEIAEIISKYSKYNARRKPELLDASTYSQVNYREAEKVVADYEHISIKAEEISRKLPASKQNAFFQLVLFPAKAGAIVNKLYLAAGKNELYAKQGRATTIDYAADTRQLFTADTSFMGFYNRNFADGRWNHFMDQAHLGYIAWNDPPTNNLQAITLHEPIIPNIASMGIAIESSESAWPAATDTAILPTFDSFNKQERYIDIFNKGTIAFEYIIKTSKPWILPNEEKGIINKENRLWIHIDWNRVPIGLSIDTITISGTNEQVKIEIKTWNPKEPNIKTLHGFIEGEGFVSMEAEHFTKKINTKTRKWIKIEDYGHTLSGMRATTQANIPVATPEKNAPYLEYKMYLFKTGKIQIQTICGSVLNFMHGRAIRYAISIDNEIPQTITLIPEKYDAQNGNKDWENSVSQNARFGYSSHKISKPGNHSLKIWILDPGVVLQKIIVNTGGLKPSYLGPPESFYQK